MMRVTLHEVLGKAWVEAEMLVRRGERLDWQSIGRTVVKDIEDVDHLLNCAGVLADGLDDLIHEVGSRWVDLPTTRI